MKSLSSLEAAQKELEDVKKAIEVCYGCLVFVHRLSHTYQTREAELIRESAVKRAEADRLETQKLAEAVASTQVRIF